MNMYRSNIRLQHPRRFVIGGCQPVSLSGLLCLSLAVLTVMVLLLGETLAADIERAPGAKPVALDNAEQLASQLSDDSFLMREEAMRGLWKLGQKALPALLRIKAGDDPEASDRAKELILYISSGVLFDSPKELKEMVIKFSRSNAEEKVVIMRRLLQLKHWKQVLYLAKFEKDPDARAQMSTIVRDTAYRAARTAIAKDDLDLAEEILDLTEGDTSCMQMRAWFKCRRGQLEQELKKADGMTGQKATLWKMALYRASGNIPAAIREAQKAGEQRLGDALRVLDGDALPWLLADNLGGNPDGIYALGCAIQKFRLQGQEKEAQAAAQELENLAQNKNSTSRVITCLAANGFREEAVHLLHRNDVQAAFDYYDSTESPQLSLEVLGIPKDAKPPYTDWLKEFTAEAVEDQDPDLYRQLIMLASFLVSRGEAQHAIAVLTPMMSALADDGSDEWFELIAEMPAYGLASQAVHFIKQRGNEDGEVIRGVRELLGYMSDKSRGHIWEHLKEHHKEDIGKALDELALLAGLSDDPDDRADKLHKTLVDEVAEAQPALKLARMSALFEFCLKRNDLATAARMADSLAVENRTWKASKNFLDDALLRWENVESALAEKLKSRPGDYPDLMKYYITLSKLGRHQKAREVYDHALLLSMGNVDILSTWGWLLYEAGYEKEAAELWVQAALVADPEDSGYDRAMVYLTHYAQPLYRSGQWKRAAAISEVSTRLMMGGETELSLQSILRSRYYSEFCHGMLLLQQGERAAGIKKLDLARRLIPGDGLLADDFFPLLRGKNLGVIYNQWFEESYGHIKAACERFPGSHNSHNTAAWLAARAVRKMDDGHAHAEVALKARPSQGAYLDTMAEIWFAKGNRKRALEWSRKAIAGSITNAKGNPRSEKYVIANYKQLSKQYQHFKNDPLPLPRAAR